MKKFTIVAAICVSLFSLQMAAQHQANETDYLRKSTHTAHTRLEPMINMAANSFRYTDNDKVLSDYGHSVKGLRAGLSFQAGITPSFSLVSDLYYLRKGGKLDAGNPLTHDASTIRLHTVELPVLARVHVGKFYVNAGPSVGYIIGGKQKINDLSVKLLFNNSATGYKRFEAGVQAGAGFYIPFKDKTLGLDLRYAHGLTRIAQNTNMYNRALMISVHFSKAWKRNPLAKK
ncbi:MAG: PorT family protein [Chitinophagales bacterium]|nr:PorT family protein [Chitinophagales bacterium]